MGASWIYVVLIFAGLVVSLAASAISVAVIYRSDKSLTRRDYAIRIAVVFVLNIIAGVLFGYVPVSDFLTGFLLGLPITAAVSFFVARFLFLRAVDTGMSKSYSAITALVLPLGNIVWPYFGVALQILFAFIPTNQFIKSESA